MLTPGTLLRNSPQQTPCSCRCSTPEACGTTAVGSQFVTLKSVPRCWTPHSTAWPTKDSIPTSCWTTGKCRSSVSDSPAAPSAIWIGDRSTTYGGLSHTIRPRGPAPSFRSYGKGHTRRENQGPPEIVGDDRRRV